MVNDSSLLEVRDLRVSFASRRGWIHAVDGVSLDAGPGQTVALVGESGCGKSVTALSLARLVPPSGCRTGGRIRFRGEEVFGMGDARLRALRGGEISYVFQEPTTSLNPVFRAGRQIGEAVRLHRRDVSVREEVMRLMELVGLPDPGQRMRAYPHQLSGGMQQRVMIAMALACRPRLLVADEPTTALDVTIQAQIMDLLLSLQREMGMAVLLITHNLGLVADLADRLYVMYAGQIMESGPAEDLLRRPLHPYTRALLAAVPRVAGSGGRVKGIEGGVPHPARLPGGCRFHPRCAVARELCRRTPAELSAADPQRWVRCHYWK